MHAERAHPDQPTAADMLRKVLGCTINGHSKAAPILTEGTVAQGTFEAPCGDNITYATMAQFPTLGHYRRYMTTWREDVVGFLASVRPR